MNLTHWIHHLINPHCEQCKALEDEEYERNNDELVEARAFNSDESEKERQHHLQMTIEKNRCYSCEVLERQLSEANGIIKTLLEPKREEDNSVVGDFKPIIPGKRWSVIQREMEKKDRELARSIRENREKEITPETLEKELAEIQADA